MDRRHLGTAEQRYPGDRSVEPLRGLRSDAAYLASVLAQVDGPAVLVGHSYGGALITVAGAAENVVAFVYVAAYVPHEGESLGQHQGNFPESPLTGNLKEWTYPLLDGDSAVEVTIEETAFPSVFAADVSEDVAGVLAAAQRPLATAAFTETASAAAWRTKPSWALAAGADRVISAEVQRFGAARAGAVVVELRDASHAVVLFRAHPGRRPDQGRGSGDELTDLRDDTSGTAPVGSQPPRSSTTLTGSARRAAGWHPSTTRPSSRRAGWTQPISPPPRAGWP
ncbi:alpha/beta hydrolase [Streptomyces sp. NPDC102437]|uniref:alpha/beta hydrolase n=1 Tax=Streptomyces sp. NPDC102437 TaxID=3366175 RepID=UPI003811000A